MNEVVLTLVGSVVGAAIVIVVLTLRRRHEDVVAEHLLARVQQDKSEELAAVIEQLKLNFSALSRDALSTNTDDFLKLAVTRLDKQTATGEQQLDEKKKLIDARLNELGSKLADLNLLIQTVEKQRSESHGALRGQVEKVAQATGRLQATTSDLHIALANPQARGQWGERMAEDVLRLAGFIEGVNYTKQQLTDERKRPDFTFSLPGNRRVHMDVKFPLANYMKMLDTDDDDLRDASATQFIRDVRARIKEVTTRTYIDPSAGTVDYVLVFIPNEKVYGFIHERDHRLLDDAMRAKVVLCSPLTLYAILAVIRQSVDSFHLEENAKQILQLLAGFKKQWSKYVESMDKMGDRLESATKEYRDLVGVRTRQLEKQIDKIDDLRADQDAPPPQALPTNAHHGDS